MLTYERLDPLEQMGQMEQLEQLDLPEDSELGLPVPFVPLQPLLAVHHFLLSHGDPVLYPWGLPYVS